MDRIHPNRDHKRHPEEDSEESLTMDYDSLNIPLRLEDNPKDYKDLSYPPSIEQAILHSKTVSYSKINPREMKDRDDSMVFYKLYSQFLIAQCLALSVTSVYSIWKYHQFECELNTFEGKKCEFRLKNIFIFSDETFIKKKQNYYFDLIMSASTISLILLRVFQVYFLRKCNQVEDEFIKKN